MLDVDYSVPPAFAGRRVAVWVSPSTVRLSSEGVEIAVHRRSFVPADVVLAPAHGRAIRFAREARDRLADREPELPSVDLGAYDALSRCRHDHHGGVRARLPVAGAQGSRIKAVSGRLASRARDEGWDYEAYLAAVLAEQVRARDSEPDPMIWDEQNVVINVRGKGLVVVSGCSHAGAVNILRNAQRLAGEERIAGLVGGLHLTGSLFEPIIGDTVAALAEMHAVVVMRAHCTGWQAVHALARTMPDGFIQPSIGTSVRC